MIRHLVLLSIRSDVSEEHVAGLVDEIAAIRPLVPGMDRVLGGRSVSEEGLERGYTHAFTIDFETCAALATYLSHPAHAAVAARIVAATRGGLDGICVVDVAGASG